MVSGKEQQLDIEWLQVAARFQWMKRIKSRQARPFQEASKVCSYYKTAYLSWRHRYSM